MLAQSESFSFIFLLLLAGRLPVLAALTCRALEGLLLASFHRHELLELLEPVEDDPDLGLVLADC